MEADRLSRPHAEMSRPACARGEGPVSLLLLPGDGIGPEVINEVARVAARLDSTLRIDERPFGGASLDAHGEPP